MGWVRSLDGRLIIIKQKEKGDLTVCSMQLSFIYSLDDSIIDSIIDSLMIDSLMTATWQGATSSIARIPQD